MTKIKLAIPLLLPFLIWELCSFIFGKSNFPHLTTIIMELFASFKHDPIIEAQGGTGFLPNICATAFRFIVSLFSGVTLGFFLPLFLSQNKLILKGANILTEFIRVVPPLILLPFLFLVLGVTHIALFIPALVYTLLTTFVYTTNAINNIEQPIVHFGRQFNPNWLQYSFGIIMPAIFPVVLNSVKVTASICMGVVIVSEFLASPDGLGSIMKFSSNYSDIDLDIISIIWAVSVTFVTVAALIFFSRKRIAWFKE